MNAPTSRSTGEPWVVLGPVTRPVRLRLREVWEARGLIYTLAWRRINVRYKQTLAGSAWMVLQPLLTTGIFTALFGRWMQVPTGGIPYPVFALSGLVLWTYFVAVVNLTTMSLVHHYQLITRVYFPRLVLPLSLTISELVDMTVVLIVLAAAMLLEGVTPGPLFPLFPVFVLMAAAGALGIGLWLGALNVQYRDVSNALPFLVQVMLFATPIAYPAELVPANLRMVYALNPMTGTIEGFRWVLFAAGPFPGGVIGVSALSATAILVSGLYFFRAREDRFADII
ncbi:MAG TPA: ABC transporter permease [Longimicrobiales bacterium]|nr:ABC transporter permease [Longimicrobiales bacterium]